MEILGKVEVLIVLALIVALAGGFVIGVVSALGGVFLGGWLVFRTKTMEFDAPMIRPGSIKDDNASRVGSYVDFGEQDMPVGRADGTLETTASRIADQRAKKGDSSFFFDEIKKVKAHITGKPTEGGQSQ